MSDKNSKITDALGLLTTIFLNWLFFTASLGFFSPHRLAFFHRIIWLFLTTIFLNWLFCPNLKPIFLRILN